MTARCSGISREQLFCIVTILLFRHDKLVAHCPLICLLSFDAFLFSPSHFGDLKSLLSSMLSDDMHISAHEIWSRFSLFYSSIVFRPNLWFARPTIWCSIIQCFECLPTLRQWTILAITDITIAVQDSKFSPSPSQSMDGAAGFRVPMSGCFMSYFLFLVAISIRWWWIQLLLVFGRQLVMALTGFISEVCRFCCSRGESVHAFSLVV